MCTNSHSTASCLAVNARRIAPGGVMPLSNHREEFTVKQALIDLPRRKVVHTMALCASAALIGLRSRTAAAEPPPETTRIRLHDAPIACFAPSYLAGELLAAEGFTDVQYV